MSYDDAMKAYANRLVVRVTKNPEQMDDRVSLYGEPFHQDDNGVVTAEIPAHKANIAGKMYPHYSFSEAYERGGEPPKKAGRPRKEA